MRSEARRSGPNAIGEELGKLAGPMVLWTLVSLVAAEVTLAIKGMVVRVQVRAAFR